MMSVLFSLQKELLRPWKIELGSRYHSCMVGWQLCYQYTSITIKNEALFSDTKIVTSVYSQSLREDAEMINKIKLTEFL
jgi:hypothetical protein